MTNKHVKSFWVESWSNGFANAVSVLSLFFRAVLIFFSSKRPFVPWCNVQNQGRFLWRGRLLSDKSCWFLKNRPCFWAFPLWFMPFFLRFVPDCPYFFRSSPYFWNTSTTVWKKYKCNPENIKCKTAVFARNGAICLKRPKSHPFKNPAHGKIFAPLPNAALLGELSVVKKCCMFPGCFWEELWYNTLWLWW